MNTNSDLFNMSEVEFWLSGLSSERDSVEQSLVQKSFVQVGFHPAEFFFLLPYKIPP